jgi:hypothetical protein
MVLPIVVDLGDCPSGDKSVGSHEHGTHAVRSVSEVARQLEILLRRRWTGWWWWWVGIKKQTTGCPRPHSLPLSCHYLILSCIQLEKGSYFVTSQEFLDDDYLVVVLCIYKFEWRALHGSESSAYIDVNSKFVMA